jgi:hypothetical protein
MSAQVVSLHTVVGERHSSQQRLTHVVHMFPECDRQMQLGKALKLTPLTAQRVAIYCLVCAKAEI